MGKEIIDMDLNMDFDLDDIISDIQTRKKIISIDFDDVLWDIQKGTSIFLKERYGYAPKKDEIPTWAFLVEEFPDVITAWSDWKYYGQGGIIDGSVEFINNLKEMVGKNSIQIVTASFPEIIDKKNELILDIFNIEKVNIIHTRDKHLFTTGTTLIDDAMHNILKHVDHNNDLGILVDFGYGWNQEPIELDNGNIFRAKSYKDILNLIQS